MSELAVDEPVIVLTGARCGSTLLRLLLDAHPELACPPETNVVKVAAQLAAIHDLVGTADDASTRDLFASVFTGYLTRRGKRRWCDKSLGTAPIARWLANLFPEAKFLCLYRHCFDVIHSGLEASPWGLMGYGFEQFAGRMGGNNAAALAAYWADHTSQILQFELAHPGRCLRVHYENLAREPDRTAAQIFAFLGVEHVPGISDLCFVPTTVDPADPGLIGPGDHKVRATSKISAGSVGKGVRVPADLIPPPQLGAVNLLLAELGYTQVDDAWRTSPCPPALLAGQEPEAGLEPGTGPAPAVMLGDEMLRTVLASIGEYISDRIAASFRLGLPRDQADQGRFGLVAYHPESRGLARGWQVDPGARSVSEIAVSDNARLDTDWPDTDWLMTGDIETWIGVLSGRANLASCLRNGSLRYITSQPQRLAEGSAAALETERRLSSARELLGLTGWTGSLPGSAPLIPGEPTP